MKEKLIKLTTIGGLGLASLVGGISCSNENPIANKERSFVEYGSKGYKQDEMTQYTRDFFSQNRFGAIKNIDVVGDDVVLSGDFQRITSRDKFGRETRVPFDKAVVQVGDSDTKNMIAPRLRLSNGMACLPLVLTGFYNNITWSDKYWIDLDPAFEDLYKQFQVSE